MKKKFNKDLAKHWLMPYIKYQVGTFYGLSLPAFRFVLSSLKSNITKEDKIHISVIGVLPLGIDTFCLSFYVYRKPDDLEFVTSRPLKRSTLKKFGRLLRERFGFYRFDFYSLWITK